MRTPRNIAVFLIPLALITPAIDADAAPGDDVLWAAPTFDVSFERHLGTRYGAGVQAGYRRGLKDDWNLDVVASWAVFPGRQRGDLLGLALGPAYVVDASRWILALHLAPGVFASPLTHRWPVDAGIEAGITLEHRFRQPVSLGIRVAYRRLIRSWNALDGTLSTAVFVAGWL